MTLACLRKLNIAVRNEAAIWRPLSPKEAATFQRARNWLAGSRRRKIRVSAVPRIRADDASLQRVERPFIRPWF